MKHIQTQIEVVESGYEFLLAYAAQGREDDLADGRARSTLTQMDMAMGSINEMLDTHGSEFNLVIANDIPKARAAIAMVLASERLSSELVDNLNASIHVRCVLTDLFILSEALPVKRPV
ncbi:MAG: hypothetical protein O3A63_00935 [Proteobacteria bacterium]|nr:hypothetical protein [Pseudomonadota bacterium]